jgi:hypothetical protein
MKGDSLGQDERPGWWFQAVSKGMEPRGAQWRPSPRAAVPSRVLLLGDGLAVHVAGSVPVP